ncbi:MAG: hypothetical protein PUB42_00715 [Firmicutes bacterium]|nr:hypothetical protein [Bacillota bacterium]
MSTIEALTAKAMAEVIAKGMNLCDFRLENMVRDEAACALDEIRLAMYRENFDDEKRVAKIREILEKYLIGKD